jgi:hypothetical protein
LPPRFRFPSWSPSIGRIEQGLALAVFLAAVDERATADGERLIVSLPNSVMADVG